MNENNLIIYKDANGEIKLDVSLKTTLKEKKADKKARPLFIFTCKETMSWLKNRHVGNSDMLTGK